MEVVEAPVSREDFKPLSEHEEQTPGTFFGGKPVLHLVAEASTIKIPAEQFDTQDVLKQLSGGSAPSPVEDNVHLSGVDVWVSSRHLQLWSSTHDKGLKIEYPSITVTAQDGSEVLLELNLSHPDTADEDIEFLQMRIAPGSVERHVDEAETTATTGANGTTARTDSATALFKAISDCQELNPDPPAPGEGEDGEEAFDETAPGATGWITSENMHEFMDEDGQFLNGDGGADMTEEEAGEAGARPAEEAAAALGEGAGRTRTAAEVDADEDATEDSKWQRTG